MLTNLSSRVVRRVATNTRAASTISRIHAREIIDSRGNPTVEAEVFTNDGAMFRAAVPSGASTGIHEAVELRDGDKKRYSGKGVLKAVNNINTIISPKLKGVDVTQQKKIDQIMIEVDGTPNKGKLGANAILAVSMAACRAGAAASKLPLYKHIAKLASKPIDGTFSLPVPFLNVINGGEHAGNGLCFQEFMLVVTGATTFAEAMKIGAECYHTLKGVVKKKYGVDSTNVGDEGGFAPNISDAKEGLELLSEAIAKAGYTDKVKIAMDVAASEFASDAKPPLYDLKKKVTPNDGSGVLTGKQLQAYYEGFVSKYPIVSIEDPFEQDDWANTKSLTKAIGSNVQIVGDDILVTNPVRVKRAIEDGTCNALLLKVNQIGSVSESIEAVVMAQNAGWGVMASHRSGETEDTFIADLAVGLGTKQIKTGAPCRSERLAKYNQLLRIEEELGKNAVYPGVNFRK